MYVPVKMMAGMHPFTLLRRSFDSCHHLYSARGKHIETSQNQRRLVVPACHAKFCQVSVTTKRAQFYFLRGVTSRSLSRLSIPIRIPSSPSSPASRITAVSILWGARAPPCRRSSSQSFWPDLGLKPVWERLNSLTTMGRVC